MISIETEKNRKLTTEQICVVEDYAAQAANDNGFINRFIFERAIFVFAAIAMFPDRKDEIDALVGSGYDIRLAFDWLVENGFIEKMCTEKEYSLDMENLLSIGNVWLEDVEKYEHSVLGLVGSINDFSGDILKNAVERLESVSGGNIDEIRDIADRWGLNNAVKAAESN